MKTNSTQKSADVSDKKGPAVKFPPPLLFVLCTLLGGFMDYHWHIALAKVGLLNDLLNLVGAALLVLAVVIVLVAFYTFYKAKTHIEPWKPTSNIITTGIFAYSRNPIYIAMSLVPMGLGFIFSSFWILISLLPALVAVYFVAIKKEEAYLEQKFGEEYLQYQQKVRRWL